MHFGALSQNLSPGAEKGGEGGDRNLLQALQTPSSPPFSLAPMKQLVRESVSPALLNLICIIWDTRVYLPQL